jgi:hypothetical protein
MTRNKALILVLSLFITALFSTAFTFLYLDEKQVHGTILDATSGRSIAAAQIQIGGVQIVSNQFGQFSVGLPQKKNIFLEANALGYLPTAFTFDLPWYLRTSHLNIKLTPLGLSLKVVDSWTDTPLENLTVRIGDLEYRTDRAGMVNLTAQNLEPPLLITVTQPGYLPKQMKLTRLPHNSAELPLLIELEPHVLTGFVIAEDTGQPLADVTVTVGDDSLQTDEKGRFFLFRLQPGQLISVKPAQEFHPTDFLFEGQSTVTIELPPRQLKVEITDALTGLPVAEAQVQTQNQAALADPQGEARLQHISAQGMLLISHPAYFSRTVTYHIDQPATITLIPNTVRGVIRDAHTGQPLNYVQGALNGTPFTVGADGHYQLANLNQAMNVHLRFKQAGYKPAWLTINFEANLEIKGENLEARPCQTDPDRSSACFDLFLQPFSAKAVYIPFNLLAKPDSIQAIFDLVDRTELNAIVVDVKGDRGFLAWDSQVLQADSLEVDGNREGWLPLETFLAEAQARDIYTIARMVIFKDTPLAFGDTDLAVKQANGTIWLDGEGLAWVNPFREEVWAYNIALAEEIAAMGFDEINLDYIRFPSDGNIEAITFPQENTLETRTTAIRTFISLMRQALAPYGTYLSADVFGLTVWVDPENDMNIGQRVRDIAPYVDYLSPMIYPSTFIPGNLGLADPTAHPYDVIFRSQNAARERVPPSTLVRPWLQAYWYSDDEMLWQKQAANDASSAGWLWWNAAGVYDEAIFEAN